MEITLSNWPQVVYRTVFCNKQKPSYLHHPFDKTGHTQYNFPDVSPNGNRVLTDDCPSCTKWPIQEIVAIVCITGYSPEYGAIVWLVLFFMVEPLLLLLPQYLVQQAVNSPLLVSPGIRTFVSIPQPPFLLLCTRSSYSNDT